MKPGRISAISAVSVFGRDRFLGRCNGRRQAGGFSVAAMLQTVPEDRVEEHTHAEAHFVLLQAGHYVSSAAGAPDVAEGPALIYNPPGTRHRDRFRGEGGRFLAVSMPASTLHGFADAVALPDRPCVLGPGTAGTADRLAASDDDDVGLESLCVELLAAAADRVRGESTRTPPWLWRARERIHDDCGADLVLSDIAAAAGVHPVHLTRAFRRHFGCTPGDYLRRCRLNKAARLLAETHNNLAGIAADCGYADQPHFAHAFRAAFGVSPRQYRRQVC